MRFPSSIFFSIRFSLSLSSRADEFYDLVVLAGSRVSSSENWWASRRHIIVDLTIGWLFPWRQNDGMTGYGNFHAFFRIGDLERWILRILNFVNAYVSIARRKCGKNCATLKLCVNGNWLSFQKLFNFCKIYGLYLYLRESEIDYFRYCKTVTFFLRFSNLFARFEWIAQIFSRFKRLLKTLYNQLLSFQNFKRLIFQRSSIINNLVEILEPRIYFPNLIYLTFLLYFIILILKNVWNISFVEIIFKILLSLSRYSFVSIILFHFPIFIVRNKSIYFGLSKRIFFPLL